MQSWYDDEPMFRRHRTRFETPGHVRFLTFSCYRRLALFQNDAIKTAFAEHLERCRASGAFSLFGCVIMPEYIHLLMRPNLPDHPVSAILRRLKEPFARQVIRRWRELEAPVLPRIVDSRGRVRFWQRGGGYDRNIVSEDEYFEKLEYMHMNPITRGLVNGAVVWPWSSARWYGGDGRGIVQIDNGP